MKQTITINDHRKASKDARNINLKIDQKAKAVTITLERGSGEPETYTFPQENDGEYVSNWFDHIETVASDATMEYSGEHFSVCDTLEDLAANNNAFQILTDAIYAMSGIKMNKPLAAMMGNRTLLELVSALDPADGSDAGRKAPENAIQIINAELNKILKK